MSIQDLLDAIPLPEGEPIPGKAYIADGWKYRDLPRMSYDMWDLFVGIVGEGNYVELSLADYGDSKRGQLLISPGGMSNLAASSRPQ